MILDINNYCNTQAMASIILILKNIFNIIMIIAPILAIISLTFKISKIVLNPDEKKEFKKINNSILALILVFLVPVIVNAFMLLLDDSTDISLCWNSVNKTNLNSSSYVDPHNNKKNSILPSSDDYEKGNERTNTTLDKNKNMKIAFIGNSKTYVHDIPGIFKKIALEGGYNVSITSITSGGKTLVWHASNSANSIKKNYDIAVLQEQTDTMQSHLGRYKSGAVNVANELRSANSSVSIYVRECWSYNSVSSRVHKAVQTNASSVASAIGGKVIKDGQAWDRYGNDNELYQDSTHQSKKGAYLSAICIYKALTNEDPTNIKYNAGISSTTAKRFKEIARDIC